ncbi:PPE family protein [Mycobacterium spongiae]|uniref:PPE domain-containing protein n=1 Tax=Mycobacterium spongiae TaxID=886343 RepID=A0A975JZA9_9MYCO|nr:PPE family protein [Mycobacterium spongiae]QUR68075.1 PPE domain-containing protein [Mycobacterium spongiae]
MTAPVWMASPPEVHSAMLSSGPGPGPLLAAAAAWSSLSVEYTDVADELTALLATVGAGAWQGPSAVQYAAAHLPYLAWLRQASATSAGAAAQHETMAAAYTTALAAMPTLPELATNHVVHGVLLATNFFGINTIPIALNEADYVRMWIQAAATMTSYQAISDVALASTPPTTPAPPILNATAAAATEEDCDECAPAPFVPLDNLIADILRFITNGYINWDPAAGTLNGLPFDAYTDATQPLWWVARTLEFTTDFQNFLVLLPQNPLEAFQFVFDILLFDLPTHIAQLATAIAQSPQLLLAAALPGVGALAGFSGLAGLSGVSPAATVPALAPAAPSMLPPVAIAPSPVAPGVGVASASAPAPAPTATTVAGAAPTTPPASSGWGLFDPYLVPPPGIGFGSGASATAIAGAKKKAPEPDSAAAAAAAREQRRARRRKRVIQRGYGDEFLDMNAEVDPDWGTPPDEEPIASTAASDLGAGDLGFAGTARKEAAAEAAGLTTMASDEFGDGPRIPMLPETWHPDAVGEETDD